MIEDGGFASDPGLSHEAWEYRGLEGHYDEAVDAHGQPRPAWRELLAGVRSLGAAEVTRRWELGQRLIHENGVTYNVYGDPRGAERAWQLDALPRVISAEEWRGIEAAIAQRAVLLNHVLADAYGPRKLLAQGVLAPELVFAHPGYLRPMHGIVPPGGVHLHFYAADLARSPDGQWWVVGDRTQAPSGAGYALENRLVLTRMLPEALRQSQVHRLAHFFARYHELLVSLAPGRRENPRIVLLTPGPYNETYFEHVYLARYLGYTLVEGGDLSVRRNKVYLKTLSGLLPVDVILRRQDDGFCDALELRGDSMLGVAGLAQAVRAGEVTVANALGSGLVETSGIMAFLPGLCRAVLGEELRMPSVATWWCGQGQALGEVLGQIERLVIKPAFASAGREPVFGDQLSVAERGELAERLRERPHEFVAQERVALSTGPVWSEGSLQPRHLLLRVHAVANGDGSYTVMPGGLTRVSASRDSMVVSMQRGGGSKDTWVLSETPVGSFSLLRTPAQTIELSRAGFVLPSRVADNLYWLGRYTERIESTVRLLRCLLGRMSLEAEWARAPELAGLVGLLIGQGRLALGTQTGSFDPGMLSTIFDPLRAMSLRADVESLQRIAFTVRDRLSLDAWRIITRLGDELSLPTDGRLQPQAVQPILDRAVQTLAAFGGQVMEGMTREKGWRFLEMGRRLERAVGLAGLLRYGLEYDDAGQGARQAAVLEIANSVMTYRSRYQAAVLAAPLLDLLLVDETNPRSMAFQLAALREHADELPRATAGGDLVKRTAEQRLIIGLLTEVRLAQVESLALADEQGRRGPLLAMLERVGHDLREVSQVLTRTYLNHALGERQMTAWDPRNPRNPQPPRNPRKDGERGGDA